MLRKCPMVLNCSVFCRELRGITLSCELTKFTLIHSADAFIHVNAEKFVGQCRSKHIMLDIMLEKQRSLDY